jgi:GTP-binding protein Era
MAQEESRCGFIAVIGPPNVGKSTLINALVGDKVAIVSHKAQTTRSPLRGIAIAGSAQLDAQHGLDEVTTNVLARLRQVERSKILMINKIDRVRKPSLLQLAATANKPAQFAATFMISALTGDGVADLKAWLAAHVPAGPWHYPEDQVTDAPLRQLAAEITREQLYSRLHQELPYQATVETDQWQELRDGSIRIEQTIYLERESQRKIVLGKAGSTIKAIGSQARSAIAKMSEAPVHLFLFVKVREGWSDDPERYRAMGLEFPKE